MTRARTITGRDTLFYVSQARPLILQSIIYSAGCSVAYSAIDLQWLLLSFSCFALSLHSHFPPNTPCDFKFASLCFTPSTKLHYCFTGFEIACLNQKIHTSFSSFFSIFGSFVSGKSISRQLFNEKNLFLIKLVFVFSLVLDWTSVCQVCSSVGSVNRKHSLATFPVVVASPPILAEMDIILISVLPLDCSTLAL